MSLCHDKDSVFEADGYTRVKGCVPVGRAGFLRFVDTDVSDFDCGGKGFVLG